MDPIAPKSATNEAVGLAAQQLRDEVLAEVAEIGEKLEASVPDFVAFYLVGAPSLGELDLVETASAWVCDSELSFVLISGSAIPARTKRFIRAGLELRLGGMRVRLQHFQSTWLRQQLPKHRAGHELFEARRLLAGDAAPVDDLASTWQSLPSPDAAEQLLVDSLELLLRAWPEAPALERRATSDADRRSLLTKGALVELARNIGDAALLLEGSFKCSRESRRTSVLGTGDGGALAQVFAWAYGSQPVLHDLPLRPEQVWTALRHGLLETLARAVGARLGKPDASIEDVMQNIRNFKRSLRSRIRRFIKEKRRAGAREYAQLLLLLSVAPDQGGDGLRKLLRRGMRLVSILGGPILANPEWSNLRRETLLLEPELRQVPPRTSSRSSR